MVHADSKPLFWQDTDIPLALPASQPNDQRTLQIAVIVFTNVSVD
jgi:hypothetical protein